jgi:hypothetical protein
MSLNLKNIKYNLNGALLKVKFSPSDLIEWFGHIENKLRMW